MISFCLFWTCHMLASCPQQNWSLTSHAQLRLTVHISSHVVLPLLYISRHAAPGTAIPPYGHFLSTTWEHNGKAQKQSAQAFLYNPAKLGWKALYSWPTLSARFLGEEKISYMLPEKASNTLMKISCTVYMDCSRREKKFSVRRENKYPQMYSVSQRSLLYFGHLLKVCSLPQKRREKEVFFFYIIS